MYPIELFIFFRSIIELFIWLLYICSYYEHIEKMKVQKTVYKYSLKKFLDNRDDRADILKTIASRTGVSYSHTRKWPVIKADDPGNASIKAEYLMTIAEELGVSVYDLMQPYEAKVFS